MPGPGAGSWTSRRRNLSVTGVKPRCFWDALPASGSVSITLAMPSPRRLIPFAPCFLSAGLLGFLNHPLPAAPPLALPPGQSLEDVRLREPKDLDGYFPFE